MNKTPRAQAIKLRQNHALEQQKPREARAGPAAPHRRPGPPTAATRMSPHAGVGGGGQPYLLQSQRQQLLPFLAVIQQAPLPVL